MSKTITEISAELVEANKAVKPVQKELNDRVKEVLDTIKEFHRSHGFYERKYAWVDDLGYFTLHADDISDGFITFSFTTTWGSQEEESLSFDELDDINFFLEADYAEFSAMAVKREEAAKEAELISLRSRLAELEG